MKTASGYDTAEIELDLRGVKSRHESPQVPDMLLEISKQTKGSPQPSSKVAETSLSMMYVLVGREKRRTSSPSKWRMLENVCYRWPTGHIIGVWGRGKALMRAVFVIARG